MKLIDVVNPNFYVFCQELEEAIKEGYAIDFSNPPVAEHILYRASMIKYESDELPKKAGRPFGSGKKVG